MLIREEGNRINQEENALEEILYGLLREQGIWAVLFVALLCYVLRKNEEQDKQEAAREAACQELLKQFERNCMHCEKKRRRRTQRVENKKRSCFFRLSGFLLL